MENTLTTYDNQHSQTFTTTRDKISINDFPEFEKVKYPNTPLTKEACKSLGCKPKELLYKPPECFQNISKDANIQKMHYNFYEAKRRSQIKAIKSERLKLALELQKSKDQAQVKATIDILSPRVSAQSKVSRLNMLAKTPVHDKYNPCFTQSSNFSNTSFDQIDKGRIKYMKMMQNMFKQEQRVAEQQREIQNQNQLKLKMEQLVKRKKQQEERQKSLAQKMLELEKVKRAEKDEKESKKKAIELLKKNQEENERSQKRINDKIQKIKQNQIEAEQRRKEHQDRTEYNLLENEERLKRKIEQKELEEQIRIRNLETQRQQRWSQLRMKRQQSDTKRISVIETMQANAQEKKNQIYEKIREQENKFEQHILKKINQMERLRSVSVQRDIKIQNTKEKSQKILQNRKDYMDQKQSLAQYRLQELKKSQELNLMYKKEQEKLQQKFLEENRKRNKYYQEYQRKKLRKKIEQINDKTESFLLQKHEQKRRGLQINTESQIQRVRARQVVNQMSVRNKWDNDLLQSFNLG